MTATGIAERRTSNTVLRLAARSPVVQRIVGSLVGVPAYEDEVVVRATVSRLVVTINAPVEIMESVVRDELERRRAPARIQTFVPILTERAAGHRRRDRPRP